VRVYLPTTMARLAASLDRQLVDSEMGYAVTPALREWYVEGDVEELEYAATAAAARASLRLLAADGAAPRRAVIAAEVPDGWTRPAPEVDRAAVRISSAVSMSSVVSVHVDGSDAADDIRRAAAVLAAADAGDDDAQFVVDALEDHELAWFAAQELSALVELET